MKRVVLLGSTGSIGRSTIKVVRDLEGFKLVAIAAHSNYQLLLNQAIEIRPEALAIVDKRNYNILKRHEKKIKTYFGEDGIIEMIQGINADILVCAFASSIAIYGILKAIEKRMRICLATKEILVSFGEIVMKEVRRYNTELIPIDSEHSAIYQCLEGRKVSEISDIIITASGGPFLKRSLKNIKKADVLKHPVWKMGKKITVDSATLMNKGLEVIEAYHLFNLPSEKIKVVIHPEAICHSCVQFVDGSLLCQFSTPDMRLPIQYALTSPSRLASLVKYLDIRKVESLHFLTPNFKKFPCLEFAYNALRIGKSMPSVLNGANAEAVKLFLEDKLRFSEIPKVISKTMDRHIPRAGTIEDYIEAENWAKNYIRNLV